MHQNRKKNSKTVKNSFKKYQKPPKTHEKASKIPLKT